MDNEMNRPIPPDIVDDLEIKIESFNTENARLYKNGFTDGYKRCDHMLERAQKQRYIALRNAIDTIRAFAEPILNFDQTANFEEIEKVLLDRYSQDPQF